MKTTTFKIIEVTDKLNGYGMPIVKVKASTNLEIINEGYNYFKCVQDVDESELLKLRTLIDVNKHDTVMLSIKTPSRTTNCWYKLKQFYVGDTLNARCIIW